MFLRNSWFDYYEYRSNDDIDCTNRYPSVAQLVAYDTLVTEDDEPLPIYIKPIFDLIEISSLDISCKKMSIYNIIQLLNLLPNLRSLRLKSVPFGEPIYTLDPELAIWERFLDTNKITTIALVYMKNTDDISTIITLFPRILDLVIQAIPDSDLKTVVRCALVQIKQLVVCHIKNLCLFVINPKHDQVQPLERMIDWKKLLKVYTIHRQLNRFYLQWK